MSRAPPPPPKDTNGGRNEYIPQYISAKPFYAEDLLQDTEYLSHQRSKAEQKDTLDTAKWYSRTKTGPAATKYRKGACENCGAKTHKTKECLSRPRKLGAKFTGRDIQADEVVEDISLGWDAKRDRWNGYDVREYDAVIKDYEDQELLKTAAKKLLTNANPDADDADDKINGNGNGDVNSDGEDNNDGDHYSELDITKARPPATRQLRLREDTAKYLLDLNLDSANYNPKTRSMDTTALDINAARTADLASENFSRPVDPSSDAAAFERAQKFAWDISAKPETPNAPMPAALIADSKVHLEANPTASALAQRKLLEEQSAKTAARKKFLEERYGEQKTEKTKVVESGGFVVYDPESGREIVDGRVVDRVVAKSKYAEDVWPGNHTSVFGSYWREGRWGFRCCGSFVRNSYCTGEEGWRGFQEEQKRKLGMDLIEGGETVSVDVEESRKRKNEEDGEAEKRLRMEE